MPRLPLTLLLSLFFAAASAATLRADEKALLAEAVALYEGEATEAPALREIRAILDRIVAEYPSSDLAVQVLLQETVEGIDIGALDAQIAEQHAAAPRTEPVAAVPALDTDTPPPADEAVAPGVEAVPSAPPQSSADPAVAGVEAPASPATPPADPWTDLLRQAVEQYHKADDADPAIASAALTETRRLLDKIAEDYPASDITIRIMLMEEVEGIDIAELDRRLRARTAGEPMIAAAPAPGPEPDKSSAPAIQFGLFSAATEQTEAALAFDKQAIRDLQSRLLVLGFDPNGIDGSIGKGTRGAIARWQASTGIPETGYLDAPQHFTLKNSSQVKLDLWLTDPDNKKLYDPPPPIALTVSNVNGRWSYVSRCGRKSQLPGQTISGTMQIRFDGRRSFDGTVQNSQGFNGRLKGVLKGRTLSGRINWGFFIGQTTFSGRIAEQALVAYARDSLGCNITLRKR